MVRNGETASVSVDDRGQEDGPFLQEASASWEEGVEAGIREGFYGKGTFYVRGAGDGHEKGDQANFSEYSNYYGVTAVCSTDGFGKKSFFSEEGVNLWVCAPGSDIVTTDNNNGYVVTSGTFLSASQVAGVAALLREVNGELSWRDIKLILAGSARQNDFFDPGWETGAVKYGSDVERYNYSPRYGFGVVDAEAAAELAKSWKGVGEMRTITASSDNELTIPDGEENGDGEADGVLVSGLVIPDVEEIFTEFVEVELVFSHDRLQDLDIQITSPSGTVSELVREFSGEEDTSVSYLRRTHRFGSARHLGEAPSGEWILKISDTASGDGEDRENTGTLHSWNIKVYGHGKGDLLTDPVSETGPKHHYLSFGGLTEEDHVFTVGVMISPFRPPQVVDSGAGAVRYSLTPALPAGLMFNVVTLQVTGTPTTPMSDTEYTYTAMDRGGDSDSITFNIRVKGIAGAPSFGNESIPGQIYIQGTTANLPVTLPSATSGDTPLTYSIAPELPAGLDFASDTRVISGTPSTATSEADYTYTVTDIDGDTVELMFGITILADVMPTFSGETIDDKEYIAGSLITPVTLPAATGGNTPLTYSLTPALPTGLNFNTATRVISGTPTTAMSRNTYTYTVTDINGDTVKLMFGITILADSMPDFGGETIDDKEYIAGSLITPVTLPAATGGNAPLTYSLTPALPTGLNFNPDTRVISGTPSTATSEADYTYTVTDIDGDTDERTFSIIIEVSSAPPPQGPRTSGTDSGGGGCAVSGQSGVVPDLLGAVACLILIPVSVIIRRNRIAQIKT